MRSAGALALLAAVAWLPASAAQTPAPAFDPAALLLPQDAPELQRQPALREKLLAGPHAYFRAINARFARLVCERATGRLALQPTVTLHGDAHLEQYAVSERGRGLADFDDASLGPALLDLARFGVSIRLALRERGWSGTEGTIAAFLGGYAAALRNPGAVAPTPRVVRRLAASFDRDRLACLARAEALMEELPESVVPGEATRQKAAMLLAESARLPVSFFRIKRVGALRLGIGSAADEKYLFRIEGHSADDADDVILELKEVRTLPSVDCIRSEPGPTRILVSQARLAYQPFEYAGALSLEGRSFWFHAWPDNYAEIDIHSSLESAAELREVAYDVGVQLGRGHPQRVAAHESKAIRASLLAALPESGLLELTDDLTEATVAAWQLFRAAATQGGGDDAPRGAPPLPEC